MDECLKDKAEARSFLDGDLERVFAARGIALGEVASQAAMVNA
ncbi:MAG TPA: hypothetical protein VIH25_13000 [Steroidobacteraceae bacterium]